MISFKGEVDPPIRPREAQAGRCNARAWGQPAHSPHRSPPMLPALFLVAAITGSPAVLPPNDPTFGHCVDPRNGVELDWKRPDDGAITYLLVKREVGPGHWRPWLKTQRAEPPFTLTLQSPLARQAHFAWMLFEVEGHHMHKTSWQYFCTEARPGDPEPPQAQLSR